MGRKATAEGLGVGAVSSHFGRWQRSGLEAEGWRIDGPGMFLVGVDEGRRPVVDMAMRVEGEMTEVCGTGSNEAWETHASGCSR